jgi:Cytidylyltransferase-like
MKKIVFTFGRYNPPTVGHAELIMYAVKLAHKTGAEHRIYTSQSHDASKNPLAPRQKMAFLRQIFPGVNFVEDPRMNTAFAICKKLTEEGYEDVTFVVGDDRVAEFSRSLGKYVKPRTAKGFDPKINYPFKKFQVVSSGARKAGISGTDLRKAVRKGDFTTFAKTSAARDKTLARKIFAATRSQLKEETSTGLTRKDFHDKLMSFVDFSCDHLGINEKPVIKYKDDLKSGQPSFAAYSPGSKEVYISTKNRHPMDIFRSVAHELVHHKQNLDGRLGKDIAKEGSTGSKIENEANSEAGKVMRYFGGLNPNYFDMQYVTEKAIVLAGTPGSGKDKILKEAILPCGFAEINADEFHKTTLEGNVVINGSFDYDRAKGIKESLDAKGYETIMVFVNTSNEVSRMRNEARAGKGRVIAEGIRFGKWKAAQDALNQYDQLFEKVIEVKNDLDLNQSETVIQETYKKLIDSVTSEIDEFVSTDNDRRFQSMLESYTDFSPNNRKVLVGGAGNWGTQKLTDRYAKDTPGQEPGSPKPMRVIELKQKVDTTKGLSGAPIGGDRIGDEAGLPKGPGFGDNQSIDLTGLDRQIDRQRVDRWMQSEETKKRFKARYGALSEQKMKETAAKLSRMESLDDPFSGTMSMVPATTGNDDVRQNMAAAETEKTSLFKKKKFRKTK